MRSNRDVVRFGILVGTLGLLAVACNAITGLGDDYSLKSSGPTDGDVDASTDATQPVDGSSDADAGADVDVPDAPFDAGPTFCTDAGPNVVYCTDFEGLSGPAPFGLHGGASVDLDAGAGGTVVLNAGVGADASTALDITVPVAAAERRRALLRVPITPQESAITFSHYELDVVMSFVDQGSHLDFAAVASFAFPSGKTDLSPPDFGAAALGGGDNLLVEISGGTTAAKVLSYDGSSYAVHVELDKNGAQFVGKLFVNGQAVGTPRSVAPGARPAEIWLGVYNSSGNNAGLRVRFDNLVVRRRD